MKKHLLSVTLSALFALMLLSTAGLAGAKDVAPFKDYLVVIDAGSKGTTITVSSAISEDAKLPANVVMLAPKFCKILSFESFDSKTGKDYAKLDYTKKQDKKTDSKVEQNALSTKLTKNRGVRGVFTFDSILNTEAGQHTIFGMGWTIKEDADALTMGAIAPKGQVGIGKGITLLGVDSAGNEIYGKTFKQVKAGKEYVLQMGFETQKKQTSTQEPQKTSFFQQKNALIIIVLGAVLVAAIIVLIIVLIKGRSEKVLAEGDIDDDIDEDDFEENEDE